MQALQQTENTRANMGVKPETFLSRADTRAKIAVSVLASILTIGLGTAEAQIFLFVCSAAYALGMRRPFLLLTAYGIVTVMLLLAYGFALLIRSFAPAMPPVTVPTMIIPFLRLLVMVNVILPLAFSTRIQTLLSSLKSFKLPFFLYIPLAVMVRFIPSFIHDMKQIAEALKIRGFSLSPRQFMLHPVLCARCMTVPLLFRSLKASEDLGIAAELKGLSATRPHTAYKKIVWQRRDTILLGIALTVALLAVLCNIYLGTPIKRMH
ncbi:MAG: Energy-coupling factor transporter transmembrane protein EcfT [Desulfovibrio sp.]